jgi:hypothetical protein
MELSFAELDSVYEVDLDVSRVRMKVEVDGLPLCAVVH